MFRIWWRRLKLGLPTFLGWRRLGYFIPYRYAEDLPNLGESPKYEAVNKLMAAQQKAFKKILKSSENYQLKLESFNDTKPPMPRWQQGWFPRLDGLVAYVMVRDLRPKKIVEVGSGHSTRFMAQAILDGGLDTSLTAIDPAPRADIASLNMVKLINQAVQHADKAPFDILEAGDILFIDSSHILMPGSDVDLLFNRIIPALPSGVYIHIHDITLPDDYPKCWAWRGYNEQLGVMPMILGGGYELLWASHYVACEMKDELDKSFIAKLEIDPKAFETSLWLKKR